MVRPPVLLLGLALLAPAGADAASIRVSLTDQQGAPVEDAVVSLLGPDGGDLPVRPLKSVEIVQKNQTFVPYVTAVTVGTSVAFPNEDTVQHHIYSLSKAKRFEKPLYAPGSRESVLFDRPGIVTLGCNIHDWMIAYVIVLPTPFFAQSAADGRAAIDGVPAGRYRLEVWQPRLGTPVRREITLAEGAAAAEAITLDLKPDRRIHRPPENRAGSY